MSLSRRLFATLACVALASGVLAAGGLSGVPARAEDETVTVFAAASMTDALTEVGRVYGTQGGHLQFSFAASSTLARQVEGGAPAAIFVSADEQWMDYLAQRNLIIVDTRISPLGNRLVLVAPNASPLQAASLDAGFPLTVWLGADGRLATGDPDHVPVGRYARQALTALGVWDTAEPRLARADSVRAALALVERGESPLGIVYATDAAASHGVRVIGTFPASSHPPVSYPFAILAGHDSPAVRAAFAYLTGSEAMAVYQRYGFSSTLTQ